MKKENLKDLIEIYEFEGLWRVDYIGEPFEDEPYNMSINENKEDALKGAIINLAVEKLKYDELTTKISDFSHEIISYENDKKYDHLRSPREDLEFLITFE